MKYVVISETESGYCACCGVFDNEREAFGKALLELADGLEGREYRISLPEMCEGEQGYVMNVKNMNTGKALASALVLFCKEGEG